VIRTVVEPVNMVERAPFEVFYVAARSFAMDQIGLVETVNLSASGLW